MNENPIQARERMANELIRDKGGHAGAAFYCEELVKEKQKEINEMKPYDKDRVTALHNSAMEWMAIRRIIKNQTYGK